MGWHDAVVEGDLRDEGTFAEPVDADGAARRVVEVAHT